MLRIKRIVPVKLDPSTNPEFADQMDQALGLLWQGDSAALDRLIVTHDDYDGGSTTGTTSGNGVGGALREAAEWVHRENIPSQRPEIPGYEILGEIGRGGMGVVYEAKQLHPPRVVALKVLQAGRAAERHHRAMFEREIRALASLDHPGIAAIHSAGVTPDGRAYFAMELVRGESITRHTSNRRLDVPARLELVARLCDAVHHAHLRGVIHRDLKPSNVLVVDDSPSTKITPSSAHDRPSSLVKVLDFGLARLVDAGPSEDSLSVDSAHVKGTLQYMSPEQLRGEAASIDARSDVYALGVILYEVLTGRLPVDRSAGSVAAMIRTMEDAEPPAPSRHNRECRGDVDVIVQKAMCRDAAHRYQSAAQLADDLRRFLKHEPIVARPAALTYVLGRFAQRHRALVAAILAIAVTLIVALAAVSMALVHARTSLTRAQEAWNETDHARKTAGQINDFIKRMLAPPDPEVMRARGFSLQTMLEDAVQHLDAGSLADQPEAEAEVRSTIARSYSSLGLYPPAVTQLERALELKKGVHGQLHVEVLGAMQTLASMLAANDESPRALTLIEEAVALEQRIKPRDERRFVGLQYARAIALGRAERVSEAIAIHLTIEQRAIQLDGEDSVLVANIRTQMASQLPPPEAIELLQCALDTYRRRFEGDDEHVAGALLNLAYRLGGVGRTVEAEAMLQEAIEMRERLYGTDHPSIASALYSWAYTVRARGESDRAIQLYRRVLGIQEATLAPGHYSLGRTHYHLGRSLYFAGRLDEAEPHLRTALAIIQAQELRRPLYHIRAQRGLAVLLVKQNQFEEAESLMLSCLPYIYSYEARPPPYLDRWLADIMWLYESWGHARSSDLDAASATLIEPDDELQTNER